MILLSGIPALCQTSQNKTTSLRGPYLGQKLPGDKLEIFAPSFINTDLEEETITFMPDGKECYWSVLFSGFETILSSRLENGRWSKPEVASFAGIYYDGWPAIHPNGKRMFFHSSRPNDKNIPGITAKYNIWYMDRIGNGWSEPKIVEMPVNGSESSSCPSVTKDGTICFFKRFSDDTEKICCSKLVEGKYQPLEVLPASINTAKYNFHAFISPDESLLVIPVYGRKDAIGGGYNYYISFKNNEGHWSDLINPGKEINSIITAGTGSFSADQKYLFIQGRSAIKNTMTL